MEERRNRMGEEKSAVLKNMDIKECVSKGMADAACYYGSLGYGYKVRMPEELYSKLEYIAKLEGRSYIQEAVYILKNYVAQYESEHGDIKNIPGT